VSLSSENMLALMAYADGELEGEERAAAEKLLASEPDAARFVEQLGGLGQLLQLGQEDRSAEVIAKFDVADAVMARTALTTDAKPAAERIAGVSSLAAARDKRAAGAQGGGAGLKIGAGIAAVLALAASVFLFAQHRTDEAPMAKGPAAAQPTQAAPAEPVVVASSEPVRAATAAGTGVEVSTVNSPSNSVSVFYLPSANELSTSVVVWVDETGEK
jgi:anti-sigma factor RsiW